MAFKRSSLLASLCRMLCRGGESRSRFRFAHMAPGQAIGTCPRAHPTRARKPSRCGKRRRSRGHEGSCRGSPRTSPSLCAHGRRDFRSGFRRRPRSRRSHFRGTDVALAVVVIDVSRTLLFLRERGVEVVVEVAAERRRPWETPAHPPLYAWIFANGASATPRRARRDLRGGQRSR